MKRFSEQLHKQSKAVKLQAAEKRELRERVVAYMEYHPLPTTMKPKKAGKPKAAPIFTDIFTTVRVPFHMLFKYSAVAAVFILVVLPFVAEKAVPGDVLYAVKVQFNEEVRSTLTFDSYQKVEWETERLNRRIAEARLLASEGRLTDAVEAEVAEAVKTHTENAKREIEALRADDADGAAIASIALDTTLEVQSTSLKKKKSDEVAAAVGTENEDNTASVNLIADVIDASRALSNENAATTTPPAYKKLMARIEQNTTRMYELLDSLRGAAPAEELADVQRRMEDVERSLQATIDLSLTDDVQSRLDLVGILQRTQRLIVYMTELEVNDSVDIESLVPVELTEAEMAAERKRLTTEIEKKSSQIVNLLKLVEDEEVIKKIEFAQTEIVELSAKMATSTVNFTAFKDLAHNAIDLADDSIILLEQHVSPVEVENEPEEAVGSSTATSTPDTAATSTTTETENSDGDEEREEDSLHTTESGSTTEEVIEVEEEDSSTTDVNNS